MAKTRKPRRTETSLQITRGVARDHEVGETIRTLIRFAGLAAMVFFGADAVVELSGKTTDANILVEFLGDFRVSQALAALLGGSGFVYGYRQRNLRRKSNKRLGKQIKQLEQKIDPDRSSTEPE